MKFLKGLSATLLLSLLFVSGANAQTFTKDLELGSEGSEVISLQNFLISSGFLNWPEGVDKGYFGKLTQNAVMSWQVAKNIYPASGYFGSISRNTINNGESNSEVVQRASDNQLASTGTSTASSVTLNPINVSEIRKGETLNISWDANNVSFVNIDLHNRYDGQKRAATIAKKIPASRGSIDYVIPESLKLNLSKDSGVYFVKISDANNNKISNSSNDFWISRSGWNSSISQNFTFCAKEGQLCSFTGTKDVVFGVNGKMGTVGGGKSTPALPGGWTDIKTFSKPVMCTTAMFGNPVASREKGCYVADTKEVIISVPASAKIGEKMNISWENTGKHSSGNQSIEVQVINSKNAVIKTWKINDKSQIIVWDIPQKTPIGDYKINLIDNYVNEKNFQSPVFKISSDSIIVSDLGIDKINIGENLSINWTNSGSNLVNIDLYQGKDKKVNIATNVPSEDKNRNYAIPTNLSAGKGYFVRVSNSSNPAIYADSNNFEITKAQSGTAPTITMNFQDIGPAEFDSSGALSEYQKVIIIPDTVEAKDLPTLSWVTTNATSYVATTEPKNSLCGVAKQDLNVIEKQSGTLKLTATATNRIGCDLAISMTVRNSAGESTAGSVLVKYVATARSINLTGPSTVKVGQDAVFNWTSTGAMDKVNVKIYHYSELVVNKDIDNVGTFTWQIPVSRATGQYNLTVSDPKSNTKKTIEFTVMPTGGITIVSPETIKPNYYLGETININWTSENISKVKIELFGGVPSGTKTDFTIASNLNSGPGSSFTYNIPLNKKTAKYRFRVTDMNNSSVYADTGDFYISYANIVISPINNAKIGKDQLIEWTATPVVSKFDIQITGVDGKTFKEWKKFTGNKLTWSIPANAPIGLYKIYISDVANFSDSFKSQEFAVTGSNGIDSVSVDKASYTKGEKIKINWSAQNIPNVKIELIKTGSTTLTTIAQSVISSANSEREYEIPVSGTEVVAGADYYVRISDVNNPVVKSETNKFEIKNPTLSVKTPTNVKAGENFAFEWSSIGKVDEVKVHLINQADTSGRFAYYTTKSRSYNWMLDYNQTPGNYRIKVEDSKNSAVTAMTDVFVVVGNEKYPTITANVDKMSYSANETMQIKWVVNKVDNLKVELIDSDTKEPISVITPNISASKKEMSYIPPASKNERQWYRIKISDVKNSAINSVTEAFWVGYYFTPTAIIIPSVSEKSVYFRGEKMKIKINKGSSDMDLVLELMNDNYRAAREVIANVNTANNPEIEYTIPVSERVAPTRKGYYLKLTQKSQNAIYPQQERFEIKDAAIIIKTPANVKTGSNTKFEWTTTEPVSRVNVSLVNSNGRSIKTWEGLRDKNVTYMIPSNTPVGSYRLVVSDFNAPSNFVTSESFMVSSDSVVTPPTVNPPVVTPPTSGSSTPTAPTGYTYCATEGQTCTFTGTKDVIYGANGKWATKTNRTSSISCSNATFGDPIKGTKKACYIKDSVSSAAPTSTTQTVAPTALVAQPVAPTAPVTAPVTQPVPVLAPEPTPAPTPVASYVFCSSEGQTCTFTGTKDVRYGANGAWTTKTNMTSPVSCSNATFGDPIRNVKKACYIKDSSSPTSLNRTLKVGDEGTDVAIVQETLKKKGFFNGDITGFFGRLTASAVSAFQQANALEAVGQVGPKTKSLLNSLMGN